MVGQPPSDNAETVKIKQKKFQTKMKAKNYQKLKNNHPRKEIFIQNFYKN